MYSSLSSAAKKNLGTKKAADIQNQPERNYSEINVKQQFTEERIKLNQAAVNNETIINSLVRDLTTSPGRRSLTSVKLIYS